MNRRQRRAFDAQNREALALRVWALPPELKLKHAQDLLAQPDLSDALVKVAAMLTAKGTRELLEQAAKADPSIDVDKTMRRIHAVLADADARGECFDMDKIKRALSGGGDRN